MATNIVAKFAQLVHPPSFGTLAFRNGLQYRNYDFRRLNNNDSCLLCINLVRFGSVAPAFATLERVQHVSIITGVSLTMLARGDEATRHRGGQ